MLLVIPFLFNNESKEAIMKNIYGNQILNRNTTDSTKVNEIKNNANTHSKKSNNFRPRNMQNAKYRRYYKDNTPREIKNKEQLGANNKSTQSTNTSAKPEIKLKPEDIRVKDMKNMDVEENKQVLSSILPLVNPNDKNIILKFQDLIDISYKLNRISSNEYDKRYAEYINDLPFLEKAQSVIKSVANNVNSIPKQNVDNIIQMLQNIDEAKKNLERVTAKGKVDDKDIAQSYKPLISKDGGKIEKLKNVLKILNDEV